MYLFFGYYMTNRWDVGTVVAYLHDIADVPMMTSKVLSETNVPKTTAIVFVFGMGVWAYTRLYILPYEMIYEAIYIGC